MKNSRLNRTYALHDCSSNMDEKDLTISKSEEYKETVNYSLDYDVCKSKDTSGCLTQWKYLHKAENDSEVFTTPNQGIKIGQSCSLAETEILKKPNDNGKYDSQDDVGTEDSQDDVGTDDSQDDDGTDDSQEGDCSDSCNKKDEADLFDGTHETQVSEGGEADLHKHFVGCKKNPGHTKFVPINDFNINHLPEGHHDNDLVEHIKAAADLTVRVGVKMTSTGRPEFWPDTTIPYAFYNMRGSDVMRVGTGLVCGVNKWTEKDINEDNKGTCPCHKCQHSDTPSKVWEKVRMQTARHVVFDDLEARHTMCRLFYDRQDSPLVTLDGWTVVVADIEKDRCLLKCVTCDVDLLDKLDKMERHWCDLWWKVNNKYRFSSNEVKLTFIVSHPHGCPKQVSVGQWIDRYVVDDDESDDDIDDDEYDVCGIKYTYTTCTCPGSSGAWVHSLGYDDDGWYHAGNYHSGVNSKGNNFSGIGREMRLYRECQQTMF